MFKNIKKSFEDFCYLRLENQKYDKNEIKLYFETVIFRKHMNFLLLHLSDTKYAKDDCFPVRPVLAELKSASVHCTLSQPPYVKVLLGTSAEC